ncbi:MAG: LytTR family DNA-binding domain-containing protein [Lachnospiraceae bacterium]|nr:LytTR family DNA-binding domain-containing protein [Lachnospiraceae bacterium]
MLKIAIADDNEELLDIVQKEIDACITVPTTIQKYSNPELLLYDVQDECPFDVYMLDVEMPEINGLNLAKKIRSMQEDACIIFLTSHPEFALASYDIHIQAHQYILKQKMHEQLPLIMQDVVEKMHEKKYYTIQTQVRFSKVDCEDVLYIYKDGKNAVIVTGKEEYRERKTLEKTVKDMQMPELVFIERGYVINIFHIRHIRTNVIEMDNGKELFISRKNIKKVKEQVNQYWSKNL